MQKTIFITGASNGLGKAAAILFHTKGWKVIATMRNPEKETTLNQLDNVTLLPLDVTDPAQIKTAAEQAIASGNIDVVFNNAGYGLQTPLEAISDEEIARQINTNLLGVISVTRAFIPHFREKKSGLFISTTSIGGIWGFPLSALYNATKFAVEGWSESMSYELSLHNIGIKTVAPGGIRTNFFSSIYSSSLPAYQAYEEKVLGAITGMLDAGSTPAQIAEVVYEAATDGKDQIRYIAGADAQQLYSRWQEIGSESFRKELKKHFD